MPKTAFFSYCFFEDLHGARPRPHGMLRPRSEAARSFAAQQPQPPQRKVEQKKMNDPFVMGILSCLNSLPNCLTAVKYLPFYIGTHMHVWLLRAYAVLY